MILIDPLVQVGTGCGSQGRCAGKNFGNGRPNGMDYLYGHTFG